jgi:hypothetical protein
MHFVVWFGLVFDVWKPMGNLLWAAVAMLQVVAGAPGSRMIDLVVPPQLLVQQDSSRAALRLHGNYYITKQVGRTLRLLVRLCGAENYCTDGAPPRQ